MSQHLSAFDTIALIHHELGAPDLAVVEPREGPRALRSAVAAARKRSGPTLVAMPTSGSQTAYVRTWFTGAARDGLQSVPFDGGVLLLLHVVGLRPAPAARTERAAPKPWTTPDAAPVVGSTESDLDDRVVRRILRACDGEPPRPIRADGNATERFLGGYGLLAHDGVWRPTVAAMVLCGLRPEVFIPGCAVHVEVDGEVTELRGPLRRLLRDTMRWMPEDVDEHVVSEAIVNALIHRDWSSDEPVRVRLDHQRLTVIDQGSLGQRGQRPPNPLLLHLAQHLGLASGQGRGLRDMGERLAAKRLPPPSLFERDGTVVFVADLRRKPRQPSLRGTTRDHPQVHETPVPTVSSAPVVWAAPPVIRSRPVIAKPPEMVWEPVARTAAVAAPVPTLASRPAPAPQQVAPPPASVPTLLPRDPDDRAEVVLAHLRAHRDASTRELARTLGCSRAVVGKLVSSLVDEGRIRPLLASSRSPHQRYALVDDHPQP